MYSMFTPERSDISALRAHPRSDVLIIGGGINGLALLRELALQGASVTLVERADYLSGASAASSHMVHGGIRYLENGEFRLVRESVEERNALLELAPHCVTPLRTTIPIYSTFSGLLSAPLRFLTGHSGRSRERGALVVKFGLLLYDAYSRGGGVVPRHRVVGRTRALRELPALNPNVRYAATYFDARMASPERLGLDVLHDALAASPLARAVNYVEVVGLTPEGVVACDRETGLELTLDADVVVNCSGPWTDLTNGSLAAPTSFMGGTKGSHIVVDHPALLAATGGRELFFEHEDGRIVLVHPIGDRVLVGTTDLEHHIGDPIVCSEEEVDYFFALVTSVFPSIELKRSDIVYRFAGVRPLPAHGTTSSGQVSRDYRVEVRENAGRDGRTILSLVGGKWTTFRALAAQLGHTVLDRLDRADRVRTRDTPIGGGRDYPRTAAQRVAWVASVADGVERDRVEILLDRYGTRAAEFVAAITAGPDEALMHAPDYSRAEVSHLVRSEQVCHLDDIVLRRTSLAFEGRVDRPLLAELAGIIGHQLNWDVTTQEREIHRTVRLLDELHGVNLHAESADATPGMKDHRA